VIGEEDGGVGTLAAIQRGYRADGAVIMEPTGLDICPVQAGALNFRITVRGKAAHGCVRDEGVSALEKFEVLHKALQMLERERNRRCSDPLFSDYGIPFPLSVGVIKGGDWASSVPDWVQVEGRYGVRPDESLEEAKEDFRGALVGLEAADPWFRDHPPELEWWGGRFRPAAVSEGDPIVLGLQDSFQALGMEPRPLKGVTFGSDMRLLVREGGTPTVLFGPGNIRTAHATDEAVSVEDVHLIARILALTALRYCGYEDEPSV
jgi:acetylornithine deacetylase